MGWPSDLLKEFPLDSVAREQLTDRGKRSYCCDEGYSPSSEDQKLPTSDTESRQRQAREGSKAKDIFVREKGVLWKRHPSGGFQEKPYCPSCKLELNAFPPGSDDMLACPKCNFIAIFRPSKSREVLAKLTKTIPEEMV